MKRFISLLLSIVIIFLIIPMNTISVLASDSTNSNLYYAQYSGTAESSGYTTNCVFTLNQINGNTFSGRFAAPDLPGYDFDEAVQGNISLSSESYTCTFTVNFRTYYYSNVTVVVYPKNGIADCTCVGSWHADTFQMSGTVDRYYNKSLSYNEIDMKMCMDFSYTVYQGDTNEEVKQSVTECINKYNNQNIDYRELEIYKFGNNKTDSNKDDVAFGILNRKNSDNSMDIIVVIRGTLKDEWQGNVEITGQTYNPDIDVHDNFEKAKDSIKDEITAYYRNYYNDYNRINLIITGHSRGAAVANLYAKEATDIKNDINLNRNYIDNLEDDNIIPKFESVTAYTFACPNNTKIKEGRTESYMKSYDNIFNFWFDSDIVPLVPPREPEDGWNYWKYGQCYTMDISDYYTIETTRSYMGYWVHFVDSINNNIGNELNTAFSQWPSVNDYYNKEFLVTKDIDPSHNYPTHGELQYVTLYEFLHTATSFLSTSQKIYGLGVLRYLTNCRGFDPLIVFAITNLYTIKTSHDFKTYNEIINGSETQTALGDSEFIAYSYNQNSTSNNRTRALRSSNETEIEYDSNEVQKLYSMANYSTNNDILEWDLTNPSTWDGITWNSDGNVTSIDLSYKWLTGALDCSNFTALTNLNIYGNSFTSMNILGDTDLISLNCGFNDFSSNGLTLTDCTSLTDLFCDGCGLTTINLSTLTDLETLSCSFNNLIALDISYNSSLKHIACIYNYLDISANSTLYTDLNGYKTANNAYLNYYPQRITENAIVDADEMLALKNFANIGDNNQILDWLDENGNISLEKLQYYALFEYDGTKYRVIALDIANLPVEGPLDLSAFSGIEELYCENTGITSLNVSGCIKLETLSCESCEISSLTLPSNASSLTTPLYEVYCEYNYIDTNIFTTQIVEAIELKAGAELHYESQYINADVTDIKPSDYNAMCDLANQGNNLDYLGWNLERPGRWDFVRWSYDDVTQKYYLSEIEFDNVYLEGDIDISACTGLSNYSFSGTDITSVRLPGNSIPEHAFYNCEELESVYLATDIDEIGEGAFDCCDNLTDVYYLNTSSNWGSVTIGNNNDCLTDANLHFTDDNPHTHFWDRGVVTTVPTCSSRD